MVSVTKLIPQSPNTARYVITRPKNPSYFFIYLFVIRKLTLRGELKHLLDHIVLICNILSFITINAKSV